MDFPSSPRRPALDSAYNRSDMAIFPFEKWRRILLRQACKAPVRELDYAPSAGSRVLREAICLFICEELLMARALTWCCGPQNAFRPSPKPHHEA